MNIFFWQNCISPHQIPFIKEICNDSRVQSVSLITPRIDYKERQEMGWNSNALLTGTNIKFYLSPDDETVSRLLTNSQHDSFHLFSGIRADMFVYSWFCKSLDFKVKRGIITEAPFTYHKPLWMHKIRFFFQDRKYIPKIHYVFGIGDAAVKYYSNWNNNWKVIPFIYCTESKDKSQILTPSHNILKLVYVGSLSKRKNVIVLLKAISLLHSNMKITLDIIGDGEERRKLEAFVNKHALFSKVTFHGTLSMTDINEQLLKYDILVLPSLHDGWGAVINEAQTLGLYTICSDNCGARLLIQNNEIGLIFRNNSSRDLKMKIQYCDQNQSIIKSNVDKRIKLAKNISGTSVATYFVENLLNDSLIKQPWEMDK